MWGHEGRPISESNDAGAPPRVPRRLGRKNLKSAEQHVAESEKIVAEWRGIVALRQAQGNDAGVARHLLQRFENDLAAHRAHRDAIKQMLAKEHNRAG